MMPSFCEGDISLLSKPSFIALTIFFEKTLEISTVNPSDSGLFPPFFIRFNAHVASLTVIPRSKFLASSSASFGYYFINSSALQFLFFCFHKWIHSTVLFIQ